MSLMMMLVKLVRILPFLLGTGYAMEGTASDELSSGRDVNSGSQKPFFTVCKEVNEQCTQLLDESLKSGEMVPFDSDFMAGFRDLMKTLPTFEHTLNHQIERLVADVRIGLGAITSGGSSSGSSLSVQETKTEQQDPARGDGGKRKQQQQTTTTTPSPSGSMKRLPPPDSSILHVGAIHCKSILPQLIKGLDRTATGMLTIPNTKIRLFSVPKTQDSTSPKVIFFAEELEEFDPLALGKPLLEQRVKIMRQSTELKDKVKEWLLDNQESNSQIVFTGHSSGAAIAQLAAIRLMFDSDLALYNTPHSVISIVFGDVRYLSAENVSQLDVYSFDHKDHIVFCSTEAYLPINVASQMEIEQSYKQHTVGLINIPAVDYIGKRLEFTLESIQKLYKAPESPSDLNRALIMESQGPLCKFLTWDMFKTQAPLALEAYEQSRKIDKKALIADAKKTLQEYFISYRLKDYPDIEIDCNYDANGDSNDFGIPSSRLTCTIQDRKTHASVQLFFHVFWTDDVHDITQQFIKSLKAQRLIAIKYEFPVVRSEEKMKEALKSLDTKSAHLLAFRYKFANWSAFFRAQISPRNPTPVEAACRYISPFFEESVYIPLKGGKFKYSLDLASEVLMKKLLSRDANDQTLIYTLFGPVNESADVEVKRPYNELKIAKMLFRAPRSSLAEASLSNLIVELFNVQGNKQTVKEFVQIDGSNSKKWGDFTVTRIDSFNMHKFESEVKLPDLGKIITKPEASHDCSYALPSKECPKMALLNIVSPFWSRMYRLGDVYLAFRGYSSQRDVRGEIDTFCQKLTGRRYDTMGAATILEIYSPKAFGDNFYTYRYYFYIMILQDPPFQTSIV